MVLLSLSTLMLVQNPDQTTIAYFQTLSNTLSAILRYTAS